MEFKYEMMMIELLQVALMGLGIYTGLKILDVVIRISWNAAKAAAKSAIKDIKKEFRRKWRRKEDISNS